LGQRILLVVTLTGAEPAAGGPEALRAALQRQLPRYLLPAEIVVRPVLPRSPNGKFDRTTLRRELAQ
jgi:acyl-CoA synthetase (AMP-forming)/AMP-acid ligase II